MREIIVIADTDAVVMPVVKKGRGCQKWLGQWNWFIAVTKKCFAAFLVANL
jgi:hypothetical protein